MNRVIWKFPILPATSKPLDRVEVVVSMPRGARVLSCGSQAMVSKGPDGNRRVVEFLSVWALVDPSRRDDVEPRRFVVLLTGEECDEKRLLGTTFLGTAIGVGGQFVAHLFIVDTAVPEGV